jgi:hypothetical protein
VAKPTELSECDRRSLLRSFTEVGPAKPIGYLPLRSIRRLLRLELEGVLSGAKIRGLAAMKFGPAACCVKSGALYLYHREALAKLLRERASAVSAAGLPVEPDDFVAHIAAVWFEENHPALPIIAAAFGRNS